MRINLVYLSPNTTGGWVTFTAHLMHSLIAMSYVVKLYKIGNRSEAFKRDFGYGCWYFNRTQSHMLKITKKDPTIIVAVAKKFAGAYQALTACGARIVIHDPTETSYLKYIQRPWVVRRSGVLQFKDATFIRHPYMRMGEGLQDRPTKRPKECVSTSRIDFDKHTNILLDAKRLGADLDIYGFENRLYTKFKIIPDYPEWEQSKVAYPRTREAAFDILRSSRAMADMSLIKGDGGGTQYTTLEAWDAGAVPIVNAGWIRRVDDMVPGTNCLTARDGRSLVKVLKTLRNAQLRGTLQYGGYEALKRHAPNKIVPKILSWLEE